MDDETRESGLQPLEREEAWQTLVRRMWPAAPARGTPAEPEIEIFLSQMPPGLPVDIPLPRGSRIVGTVLNGGGLERATVYVDVLEPPAELLDFYRTRLWAEGWYEFQTGRPGSGGFNPDDESYQMRSQFCRSERGPAPFVTAKRQGNGPTDVRISLYTDGRTSPCRPRERSGRPPNPFPPLPPPAGARFVMGAGPSGSRGPDSAHSRAAIETELDLAAVAAHYTRHLKAGGWTRQNSGQSERSAWSTWTFRHESGEAWRGLLLVFQRPDVPHRYILETWAEWLRET